MSEKHYQNDTSLCSVSMWFGCGGTFDHYFNWANDDWKSIKVGLRSCLKLM